MSLLKENIRRNLHELSSRVESDDTEVKRRQNRASTLRALSWAALLDCEQKIDDVSSSNDLNDFSGGGAGALLAALSRVTPRESQSQADANSSSFPGNNARNRSQEKGGVEKRQRLESLDRQIAAPDVTHKR